MLGDPLVHSFPVDTTSASLGLPWCAQGRQPRFVKPQFVPEQVKPFLSLADIEDILNRLNRILHDTGCPPFPLFIIPMVVMVLITLPIMVVAWRGGIGPEGFGSLIVIIPSFLICIAIYLWLVSTRKNRIRVAINQWNSTVGGPRGLYFDLGDSDGDSEYLFWASIYPRSIRINSHRSIAILSRGFIHLYTNPTARKQWCDKNREQFVLPQPPQPSGYAVPHQLAGYGVQQLPGYGVQQLPGYGVQQQLPGYGVQQLPGYGVQQQLPGYGVQQLPQEQPVYAVPHQDLPPAYGTGDQYGYHGAQQRSNIQDFHHQIDGREDHVYEQHQQEHGHVNGGFN